MESLKFMSQTYGKIELSKIPEKIQLYYEKMKHYDSLFRIVVGTDSQNFDHTKMVNVIAVTCEGHGGIFFYRVTHKDLIRDVRSKLHAETNESLEIAMELTKIIEEGYEELWNKTLFSIHIDAGKSEIGKTKELIPELVGWIRACGYNCEIKPDSYAASSIADKISK